MERTTAQEVFESFESAFQDKKIIPDDLEFMWLLKAIARYSIELDFLNFDEEERLFDCKIDKYVIDTLAAFMKQYYQEREVSKVNKRVSIVSKDISIDGNNGSKNAAKSELEYDAMKSEIMIHNQMPTAFS